MLIWLPQREGEMPMSDLKALFEQASKDVHSLAERPDSVARPFI